MPSLQIDHDVSFVLGRWTQEYETTLALRYPVHRACRDGDVNSLTHLLNAVPQSSTSSTAPAVTDILSQQDPFCGWPPVHWAAYFGQLECLKCLGCQPPAGTWALTGPRSTSVQTSAHVAALGSRPACLQWLLLHGAAVNAKDACGETPLHKAARSRAFECSKILSEFDADFSICNIEGLNATQLAKGGGTEHAERLAVELMNFDKICNGHSAESVQHKETSYHISANAYYGFHPLMSSSTTPRLVNGTNQLPRDSNGGEQHCDMDAEDSAPSSTNGHSNGFYDMVPGSALGSENSAPRSNGHADACESATGHLTNGHATVNGCADVNGRKRSMQEASGVFLTREVKRMRHEEPTLLVSELHSAPAAPSLNRRCRCLSLPAAQMVVPLSENTSFNLRDCNEKKEVTKKSMQQRRGDSPWCLEKWGQHHDLDLQLLRGTHGCDLHSFTRLDDI